MNDDLLVLDDDPFASLEPCTPDEPVCMMSLADPRIYLIRLVHARLRILIDDAVARLGQVLAEGKYAALMHDLREAQPDGMETLLEPGALAFVAFAPRNVIVVTLHDAGTAAAARRLTGLLQERGFRAGRARSFEPALYALMKAIGRQAA